VAKCPPEEVHKAILFDELDQAIHEFVGEVAELAQLYEEEGPTILVPRSANRDHAESELGDVIFTASWVMDLLDKAALGQRGAVSEGFIPRNHIAILADIGAKAIDAVRLTKLQMVGMAPQELQSAIMDWVTETGEILRSAMIKAGLLCNHFKKIRWHGKTASGQDMADLVAVAMEATQALCLLSGFTLEGVMRKNMQKINKKFPNRWHPATASR
jgi:NTP pyrophosphatase (non-canonical NTP hydrolase)